MDGKGRYMDNLFVERLWRKVKYEEVYLKAYADGRQARAGLGPYFHFYNAQRPYQTLGYRTPAEVFSQASATLPAQPDRKRVVTKRRIGLLCGSDGTHAQCCPHPVQLMEPTARYYICRRR